MLTRNDMSHLSTVFLTTTLCCDVAKYVGRRYKDVLVSVVSLPGLLVWVRLPWKSSLRRNLNIFQTTIVIAILIARLDPGSNN